MNATRTFGILPVKSFRFAKQRLSSQLSPAARRALSQQLFQIAMQALCEVLPAGQIVVVSRDAEVLRMARQCSAQPLHQTSHGLNQALAEGEQWAMAAGADALLVLLADLPLVTGAALQEMLAKSAGGQEAILARGQRGGTHALWVRPPGWLPFTFGTDSFARFTHHVSQAGARMVIHDSPALALDVDLPEDLERWATLHGEVPLAAAAGAGQQTA